MKNSLLKKTGLFCLSFFLFTCTTLPKEVAPLVYNGGRQNVILMIGDGMLRRSVHHNGRKGR